VKNCSELNIIKRTQTFIWVIVSKICTIPPYHLTDFQFLRNVVTNCIFPFPHYLLTCWRTALMSCVSPSCW